MDFCLITFRSVTPAQRGEAALRRQGIPVSLRRTPRVLAEQGCGYSIRLRCGQLPEAIELLRRQGIHYQKAYRLQDGIPEEVAV